MKRRTSLCAFLLCFSLFLSHSSAYGQIFNLLTNGDFEDDLTGWTIFHPWYEFKTNGKGTGLSRWEVTSDSPKSGRFCIKVTGSGNRGIALQRLKLPPGRYRIWGWIRTQNLHSASASVLIEFLNRDGRWFDAVTAASLSGTNDWTFFEKEIVFPPDTVWVHFDLLTDRPNDGIAWFDDWRLIGISEPKGPIRLRSGPADFGEVRLEWDLESADGVLLFQVFLEEKPMRTVSGIVPRLMADWTERSVTFPIDKKIKRLSAAVCAVGITGSRIVSAVLPLTVRDTVPPQPPLLTLSPFAGSPDRLYLTASFPLAERDLKEARIWVRRNGARSQRLRRFFLKGTSRFALVVASSDLPSHATHMGVSGVDQSGNESNITWKPLPQTNVSGAPLPADVWVTSSLDNVFRDTPPPPCPLRSIDLIACRNEEETAQIVIRPQKTLSNVTIQFSPLCREDGLGSLDPSNFSHHFVGFIFVEKNSTHTPDEELVRKAPADFPDPLREEETADLEGGVNQPILLRLTVPKETPAGRYSGAVTIVSDAGSLSLPLTLQVVPLTLPDRFPLYATNWFSLDRIAQFHKVPPWSSEFWKVLRLYAREMKRGHQNVVLTPLSLFKVHTVNGRRDFVFSEFDRYVRLFEEEGVAERIELSHLGGRSTGEWECPTFTVPPLSLTDIATGQTLTVPVEALLPHLQAHLKKRGWLEKTLLHIADEPIPVNVASWRDHSAFVHSFAPLLKRIDAIHVPWSEVQGHLEVLVPQLNFLEQWLKEYQQAQQEGAEVWFYTAWLPQGRYLNRLIDYPLIKSRLLPWICYRYRLSGWLHWGLNWWTDFKDMGFAPGDNWILYPGTFGPRSSLRWEAMRDGFEDAALLLLLSERNGQEVQREVEKVIRSGTDYTRDPSVLLEVRRRLLLSVR